jgi:hypothetical protein
MLSNRMVWVVRGVNSTMMVRIGCPQGGVLSPLLWNMDINSLLGRLNNESLWAQGFADHIANCLQIRFSIFLFLGGRTLEVYCDFITQMQWFF